MPIDERMNGALYRMYISVDGNSNIDILEITNVCMCVFVCSVVILQIVSLLVFRFEFVDQYQGHTYTCKAFRSREAIQFSAVFMWCEWNRNITPYQSMSKLYLHKHISGIKRIRNPSKYIHNSMTRTKCM